MATARPDDANFNVEENVIIWEAETGTRSGTTSGGHSELLFSGAFSFLEMAFASKQSDGRTAHMSSTSCKEM